MDKNTRAILLMIIPLVAMAGLSHYVFGANTDPLPPQSVNITQVERLNESNFPLVSIEAQAGNVTELRIHGTSPTTSWQAYYGNITGTIVLEDSQGNIFYDWQDTEPQGELFASTSSAPTWANIQCFNFTAGDTQLLNLTTEEEFYDMQYTDEDGIDETFSQTTHPEIVVGTYNVTTNTCPSTYTYVNSASQSNVYVEVLLTDNVTLIWTTIIENDDVTGGIENSTDPVGFDGNQWDFQMLVAESGSNGNDQSTTYYFWVELS